jgi:hypothetical protein
VPESLYFDLGPAGRSQRAGQASGSARSRVIVKVKEPGYVPEGFEVRARVDDILFTADATESALASAAQDPNVESIEHTRRLRSPNS